MEVYRLTRERFANRLSGKGSAIKGARWNSVGVEIIYSAANRSLAMAEVAVHFTLGTLPADYIIVTIFIPDSLLIEKFLMKDLPEGWNSFPYISATQIIGDTFVTQKKSAVLQIPSAVTKGDHNFLINPNHPDFEKIKIASTEKFPFDKRIFN